MNLCYGYLWMIAHLGTPGPSTSPRGKSHQAKEPAFLYLFYRFYICINVWMIAHHGTARPSPIGGNRQQNPVCLYCFSIISIFEFGTITNRSHQARGPAFSYLFINFFFIFQISCVFVHKVFLYLSNKFRKWLWICACGYVWIMAHLGTPKPRRVTQQRTKKFDFSGILNT